jgi:hypothetical protein
MGDLFQFVPKASLDAQANLAAFVRGCRTLLTVFGSRLDFDSNVWDVTEGPSRRATTYRQRVTFCTLQTVGSRKPVPMRQPFRDFAKAYLRHHQGLRPTRTQHARISALRALHDALADVRGNVRVWETDGAVLNRAAELLRARFTPQTAYAIGTALQHASAFLERAHLVPGHVAWRNPLPRPPQGDRIGKEFERRRAKLLPSAATLHAVATAFNAARDPGDVIITSGAAILCGCPSRIAELLTLPVDCEVPRLGADKQSFGLRWWPAKGAPPQVKWVLASMIDVVKRAIANIRRHTQEARAVAKWYERNPSKIYLPKSLAHLRNRDRISLEELTAILGGMGGPQFARTHPAHRQKGTPEVRLVPRR